MADGNLERIQSGYEAFGRGDIGAVLDILADDIDWNVTEVLPQGGHLHGKDEVSGFFERLPSVWEGLSLDIDDFVASGDRVCVIGRGSGTHDGAQMSYGFVHAWTLADGDATRFDEYADPPPELYR
jgi:ketosteroid isomerase-like protein